MSQMRANLTPYPPKAASMKGRLHVPSDAPNEHPAVAQDMMMPSSENPL